MHLRTRKLSPAAVAPTLANKPATISRKRAASSDIAVVSTQKKDMDAHADKCVKIVVEEAATPSAVEKPCASPLQYSIAHEVFIARAINIVVKKYSAAPSALSEANQMALIVDRYAHSSWIRNVAHLSRLGIEEHPLVNMDENVVRLKAFLCAAALCEMHGDGWRDAFERLFGAVTLEHMQIGDSHIRSIVEFELNERECVPLLPSARTLMNQLVHDRVTLKADESDVRAELLLYFPDGARPRATFEEWLSCIGSVAVWSLNEIRAYFPETRGACFFPTQNFYLACTSLDREMALVLARCLSQRTRSPDSAQLYFSAVGALLKPVYAQYCVFFPSADAGEERRRIHRLIHQPRCTTAMNREMTTALHAGIDRYIAAYDSVLEPARSKQLRIEYTQARVWLAILDTADTEVDIERWTNAAEEYAQAVRALHKTMWKLEMADNDTLSLMTCVLIDAGAVAHFVKEQKRDSLP